MNRKGTLHITRVAQLSEGNQIYFQAKGNKKSTTQ